MKFLAISFFVLVGSAILGGSSATPAHKHHESGGGLLGPLAHTVDHVIGDVDALLDHVTDDVHDILSHLEPVAKNVLETVGQIIKETGKGLTFLVISVLDGVLTLVAELPDGLITINFNIENLEISIGGKVVGTVCDDGSIVDSDGETIGYFDPSGFMVLAGQTVEELHPTDDDDVARNVEGPVSGLLQSLNKLVGNVVETVGNIAPALRAVLDKIPPVTAEVAKLVEQILQEVDEALVCFIEGFTNDILTFRQTNGNCLVSINLGTLKVTVSGRIIGTYNMEDGSIVDSHGQLIGFFDSHSGYLTLVGDVVGGLLCVVGGVLHGVGGLLEGVAGQGGLLDNLLR